MKFCLLVLGLHLPQSFCPTNTQRHTNRHKNTQTHTQTYIDKHFSEIVKSCSGYPKTCKSCAKPILSSIYIEESKKRKKNCKKTAYFFEEALFALNE